MNICEYLYVLPSALALFFFHIHRVRQQGNRVSISVQYSPQQSWLRSLLSRAIASEFGFLESAQQHSNPPPPTPLVHSHFTLHTALSSLTKHRKETDITLEFVRSGLQQARLVCIIIHCTWSRHLKTPTRAHLSVTSP